MKALVVYDSVHGNTEKIAQAIGGAIAGEVKILRVDAVGPSDLEGLDLLIIGSPTHGGRPTEEMQAFLETSVPALANTTVAAFDTRFATKLVAIFGYAAQRIATSLKSKGGTVTVPPEGFVVEGTRGPLKEGEAERAAAWAKEIVKGTE